jgi:imidazolonepropionase-like amidohydrolase
MRYPLLAPVLLTLSACTGADEASPSEVKAFVGARLIDGTGAEPLENAVIVVRAGRIEAVGPAASVRVPENPVIVDLAGRTVVPGFINTHGHVGRTVEADSGPALAAGLLEELRVYARYGVTTVNSLGGDQWESVGLRNGQDVPSLDRTRLLVAGAVVTGATPDEARQVVDANAVMGVDFIKIRVDDNLGTAEKMRPEVYQAVIERAHELEIPVAAHVFYQDDAKDLLLNGVDFIAHSVRDQAVDGELVQLLRQEEVCYVPTLTREISTFVYEDIPDFFADPFFLREADSAVIRQLSDSARQREISQSTSAQAYKFALAVAGDNVNRVADGGGTIAMGTDTGPFGRFQGYFEHLEMELMARAGLTSMQVIVASTGDAARCLGLDDVGTIEPGKWADLVVLRDDPIADITNTRSIESVWIAGNFVPGSGERD